MSIFKTKTTKDYGNPKRVNKLHRGAKKPRKPKIKKRSKENIIKYVKIFNKLKKENEAIKDRIIRDTEKTFSARRR